MVPVGDISDNVIEASGEVISDELDGDINIHDAIPFPESVSSGRKNQYNAEEIIDIAIKRGNGDRNIALTDADIYYRHRNFVFGLAYLDGRGCVVSTHRLNMTADGGEVIDPDEKLIERVKKEVIHELGHTLNLRHCDNGTCVMSFSPSVEEVDLKLDSFCSKCSSSI